MLPMREMVSGAIAGAIMVPELRPADAIANEFALGGDEALLAPRADGRAAGKRRNGDGHKTARPQQRQPALAARLQ